MHYGVELFLEGRWIPIFLDIEGSKESQLREATKLRERSAARGHLCRRVLLVEGRTVPIDATA